MVEGGGMRGIFTAGVLDTFLRASFDPFHMYFGVSVGACTLSSFLAGQVERHFHIFTKIACRPEFMSVRRMIKGGSFMDLDWMWDTVESHMPLDTQAIDIHLKEKECSIVCTSIETGVPVYKNPKGQEWINVLKATSSIPILYKHFPDIDGTRMADGGISDPIPVFEAYKRGARHIVVVRTRPLDVRKRSVFTPFVGSILLRRYPGLKSGILSQVRRYNEILDFMTSPPEDLMITQIAPSPSMKTGRTSANNGNLVTDYQDGVSMGRDALDKMN